MVRGALLLAALLVFAGVARADEKELPIPGDGARAVFLRAVHARVHPTWADSILRNAAERLPATHPLNDPKRSAVVRVSLIPDGSLVELTVEQSSGSPEFDAAVLAAFPDISFPQAPDESLSDDGRAYLRWTFARDRRQCSGISVLIKEGPLDVALTGLLAHRRDREALRRVRAAGPAALEGAVTMLARGWLERSFDQTAKALPAAIGLAALGDERGAQVLRAALARGDRVGQVTAALMLLKVPVPPAPPAVQPESARLPTAALIKLLRKGHPDKRLEAASILANRGDGAARQALAALARHSDPRLRLFGAAGLGASARADLFASVGPEGKEAYQVLVRGPGRSLAAQWLVAEFDKLMAPVQVELLSDWLWGSREASPVAISVR
jgi:TonB family protein